MALQKAVAVQMWGLWFSSRPGDLTMYSLIGMIRDKGLEEGMFFEETASAT